MPNGQTRLCVPNWVSKPSPGGLTRTTRWVDKATHLEGSVIALEVLESRYGVRAIFCLRQRSEACNGDVAPVVVPPFLLTFLALPALRRFGTTVCRLPCTEETGSSRSSVRQIFLPGHKKRSFEVIGLGSEGGQ